MALGLHLCRGNFRGRWMAAGGYEPVAEKLFNQAPVDVFFLEYDSERAGDFQPLRFVPKGKTAVLGLVSSKSAELEDQEEPRAPHRGSLPQPSPLDQLALSTQCGFASVAGGNVLTEDQQWAKLELVVDTAARVWGMSIPCRRGTRNLRGVLANAIGGLAMRSEATRAGETSVGEQVLYMVLELSERSWKVLFASAAGRRRERAVAGRDVAGLLEEIRPPAPAGAVGAGARGRRAATRRAGTGTGSTGRFAGMASRTWWWTSSIEVPRRAGARRRTAWTWSS